MPQEEKGTILKTTANAVGTVLNKKLGVNTGFAPSSWANTINLLGLLPVKTATKSAICSFSDGADGVPCPSVLCEINPSQASGTPSPSNPLAISGFTGLTLTNKDDISNPTHTDTYSVTWQSEAGTVYGGTLDVVSGVLTVTHKTANIEDLSWSYVQSNTPIFQTPLSTLGAKANSGDCYCSIYKGESSFWSSVGKDYRIGTGNNGLNISNSNYTSSSAFKTAMEGIMIVYPLATPVTYQLTPQEVTTLLATNNFYHDANGDTQVQYRATSAVVDSKTITANGTYNASADNLDGYSSVSVNVAPNVGTKNITQNGTYTASSESLDGYSSVTVNVSGGGTTLALHEGRISMSDGSIIADSNYYYSDFFDAPNGNIMFDLGEVDNDYGLPWYHSDGTYVDHFSSSQRFRQVNMATYYQSGDKFRLTFKKANLNSALLVDLVNIKAYCVSVIKLAE